MAAYCHRCQAERELYLELQAAKLYWPSDRTCLYMDTRQASLYCRKCGSEELAIDPAEKVELIEEAYRAAGRGGTGEWAAVLDRAASPSTSA